MDIRWYKGKYKVEVVLKSRGNWRVKSLETINLGRRSLFEPDKILKKDEEFTTVPRLLWRHPRK
jgi:hypothetical protein